jgi:hypothetical protein
MPCNTEQCGEQKTLFLCGNCKPMQPSATTDRALVKRRGQRFESARRLSRIGLSKPSNRNRIGLQLGVGPVSSACGLAPRRLPRRSARGPKSTPVSGQEAPCLRYRRPEAERPATLACTLTTTRTARKYREVKPEHRSGANIATAVASHFRACYIPNVNKEERAV